MRYIVRKRFACCQICCHRRVSKLGPPKEKLLLGSTFLKPTKVGSYERKVTILGSTFFKLTKSEEELIVKDQHFERGKASIANRLSRNSESRGHCCDVGNA